MTTKTKTKPAADSTPVYGPADLLQIRRTAILQGIDFAEAATRLDAICDPLGPPRFSRDEALGILAEFKTIAAIERHVRNMDLAAEVADRRRKRFTRADVHKIASMTSPFAERILDVVAGIADGPRNAVDYSIDDAQAIIEEFETNRFRKHVPSDLDRFIGYTTSPQRRTLDAALEAIGDSLPQPTAYAGDGFYWAAGGQWRRLSVRAISGYEARAMPSLAFMVLLNASPPQQTERHDPSELLGEKLARPEGVFRCRFVVAPAELQDALRWLVSRLPAIESGESVGTPPIEMMAEIGADPVPSVAAVKSLWGAATAANLYERLYGIA